MSIDVQLSLFEKEKQTRYNKNALQCSCTCTVQENIITIIIQFTIFNFGTLASTQLILHVNLHAGSDYL